MFNITPQVAKHIHIGKPVSMHYSILVSNEWYEHEPATISEDKKVTILWDMEIRTYREIAAIKPDIVIKGHENKTCKLIDMAVPSDTNTSIKTTEKPSKYKDLEIKTIKMKTETIPLVIGALGLIKNGLQQHTKNPWGNHHINQLQKIFLLRTAHILRKVLS